MVLEADLGLSPAHRRVSDLPDWGYLLREYYELYRFLSSGGSEHIRAHQRAVREAISRVAKADAPLHFDPPAQKPVTAHLKRALDEGRLERTAPLIRAIESVQDSLIWQYGYEKVPRGLDKKYAYAEICGPNGPIITNEVILGLVLFAPKCTYPAHSHAGISESYVCLSGAVSENHQGVYAPGSMIFNPPEHMHRITVSNQEPSLLAYAWMGRPEILANQKMVFSRPRTRKT
ncbi:putative dimethlysulfonioproprionate lyase DddL [Roseibium aquae]|uniref:Dimethlysulfonioproprionate lyase DddL n=1 Tax=Roseibium aquae TaxID=1323746 RepID=A0A916WWB2_9HYPH|nr:dimethylsulfonioproprionate lyase family protein [Roseibium aquae]GGB35599.1 putative dimethlysulfonioproprionate lyase DddL [Roseibium aquae]